MNQPEQLGPYRIESVLGKGGMGRVYRATHADSGDAVAIKALSPQLAMNDGFIERFRSEIESLRLLRHASIVRLLGYGQEGDTLFYAMELVDGPSLEDEVRQGRRFDWREVTDIATQLCRALKHAHDHGVIHRDIKPANILLAPSGKVKLADFGIARLFGGSQLTVAGGVIGTADYMAPEQVAGAAVTAQCDQYSLGGVMYALLAGRPPFQAKSLPEMLQLQRYADPEPVRRFAPDTPKQLEQAIAQMLHKAPEERFPNTLVLAKHLEAMRLALSRRPFAEASTDEPPPLTDDTLNEVLGPADATRDYVSGDYASGHYVSGDDAAGDRSSGEAVSGAGASGLHVYESDEERRSGRQAEAEIVISGNEETPAAASAVTGDHRSQPTLAIADPHDDAAGERRSLFTEVAEDRRPEPTPRWALVVQGAAAIALLGVISVLAVRWLSPPNADTLHARIEQALEPGDAASLRAAAGDVDAFLRRFPDDPRADALRPVSEAIDFDRTERRLMLKLRLRRTPDASAPPVEQLYLSAMQRAATSPAAAIAELEAIATLVKAGSADGASAGSGSLAEFGELARRQIDRLRAAAHAEEAAHRPFVEAQLQRAREAADSQPAQSRRLCEAVVALYADRPWAASLVEEAERLSGDKRLSIVD